MICQGCDDIDINLLLIQYVLKPIESCSPEGTFLGF